MENTTNQYPSEVPAQVQPHQPGDQEKMHPEPEIIKASHKGSEKLKGKVAVISGGDSGIGRSVAVLFAREGADIAVLYLKEDQDAEITKQLIEKEGQQCLLLKGDISDPDLAKQNIDKVLQHFGKINILVNNAGVQYQQKEIESISNEQLEKTFKTNIFTMFYLTKEAIPYMEEGDSIINTTSITSYQGHDELIDYA
ncbi:SDR family NAD(P)-dependent oxidoreductase, partial [Acinetobacter baumannii]